MVDFLRFRKLIFTSRVMQVWLVGKPWLFEPRAKYLYKTKDFFHRESLKYYLRIWTKKPRRRCGPEGNLVESIWQFYCLLKKKQMTLARAHNRDTVPLSVIFILQNIFHRGKELRDMSLNCHYLVMFKSPRDSSQVSHLAKQMFPGHVKYMQEAFQDATKRPYGYLLCDP